jgi:excisionase family DNA binding protein
MTTTHTTGTAKPTTGEPLLIRVTEAARMLSLCRSTIYAMLDAGELPSIRCGTARRIPVAALRDWVEHHLMHER